MRRPALAAGKYIKINKSFAAGVFAALICGFVLALAPALEAGAAGVYRITLNCADGENVFAGETFKVYEAALGDVLDAGAASDDSFAWTGAFAKLSSDEKSALSTALAAAFSAEGLSGTAASDDLVSYREILEEIISVYGVEAAYTVTTDSSGGAVLCLDRGVYIVTGEPVEMISESDGVTYTYTYTPEALLFAVTGDMDTELEAYVKYVESVKTEGGETPEEPSAVSDEEEPSDDTTDGGGSGESSDAESSNSQSVGGVQTGDITTIGRYIVAAAACLFLVSLIVFRKKRDGDG